MMPQRKEVVGGILPVEQVKGQPQGKNEQPGTG
jgi:hypothetical protein